MRRVAPLVLLATLVVGCLGPRPAVRSAEVGRPEEGKAKVTVVIENRGSGDGEVRVKVVLRDAQERVVAREDKTTDLESHETVTLVLEIDVPDDVTDLTVEADVTYPPD